MYDPSILESKVIFDDTSGVRIVQTQRSGLIFDHHVDAMARLHAFNVRTGEEMGNYATNYAKRKDLTRVYTNG